ncbi:hypothetical protein [Actinokineospora terrae]|uniref:Uncharacterized protein n=1 Tax=Actinokineospora terrae TaxID=155974 RepID=A0A1H9SJQ4_9PSEU|nr:hypothetical protein [Actinokineospora terrae]SER85174.1 hypothetical protein SAMN04487818_105496 [Actinokineospora terrae]
MKTDELESLVRDAIGDHADRAPEPADTIHAVLAPRYRRPVLAYVAAAVVVLTLLVVAPALLRDDDRSSGIGGTRPLLPAPELTVPVRVGPTWLPDGITELSRAATPDGKVLSRQWSGKLPPLKVTDPYVSVTVMAKSAEHKLGGFPCYGDAQPVDVSGKPGSAVGPTRGDPSTCLVFEYDDADVVRVNVNYIADGREVALRVARSIGPVDTAPLVVAAEFGVLPAGLAPFTLGIAKEESGLTSQIHAMPPGGGDSVSAEWTHARPTRTGGNPTTVRGRPATYYPIEATGDGDELWVDFGDMRLRVFYFSNRANRGQREVWAIGIAQSVSIRLPRNDWIGGRY